MNGGNPRGLIPMAALVAIMIIVSIGTLSWSSLKNLQLHPRSSSIVIDRHDRDGGDGGLHP